MFTTAYVRRFTQVHYIPPTDKTKLACGTPDKNDNLRATTNPYNVTCTNCKKTKAYKMYWNPTTQEVF